MSNSMAELRVRSIPDRAKKNILLSSQRTIAEDGKTSAKIIVPVSNYSKAVPFKYKHNLSRKDIDEIRNLLTIERAQQEAATSDFYTADYKRLMDDDWLVTRFLLRGIKVAGKSLGLAPSTILDKNLIYKHTMELVEFCAKFRLEYRVNSLTSEKEFPTEWTRGEGMFSYKPDLVGNPTAYLRVALHRPKVLETDEARFQFKRYMLYTLEQSDQELYNQPGKAICCVFDMTNVSLDNIDLELTTWMVKSFKNCGPKLLGYVIVYNPPWFFTATFKLICNTLLSNSKRQSIKFVYNDEILDYIAYSNLPEYIQTKLDGY